MKPGGLKRYTPLQAQSELKRTAALTSAQFSRSAKHHNAAANRRQSKPSRPAGIPAKVRAALKLRSGGVCEVQAPGCDGRAVDPSHRIKTGMGGRRGTAAARHHVLSNLLHACRGCHSEVIHAYPAAAYWQGWMLREHEIPAEVPALYRGMWVLLADDGSISPTNKTPEES